MIPLIILILAVFLGLFSWMPKVLFSWIADHIDWNPKVFCFAYEEVLGVCSQQDGLAILQDYFRDLLIPFYIVALLLNSIYFVFMSGSPRGRARSKLMFQKLIISMMLVLIAPILLQLMLDTSAMITDFLRDDIMDIDQLLLDHEEHMKFYNSVAYIIPFIILCVLLMLGFMLVLWRYLALYVFAIWFPLIIFLYFFEFTKGTGRKYLQRIIIWTYLPILQIILLGFTLASMDTLTTINFIGGGTLPVWMANNLVNTFAIFVSMAVSIAGAILILASPLIMLALLNFISELVTTVGFATANPQIIALGGIIQGRETGITAAVTMRSFTTAGQAHKDAISHGRTGMMQRRFTSAPIKENELGQTPVISLSQQNTSSDSRNLHKTIFPDKRKLPAHKLPGKHTSIETGEDIYRDTTTKAKFAVGGTLLDEQNTLQKMGTDKTDRKIDTVRGMGLGERPVTGTPGSGVGMAASQKGGLKDERTIKRETKRTRRPTKIGDATNAEGEHQPKQGLTHMGKNMGNLQKKIPQQKTGETIKTGEDAQIQADTTTKWTTQMGDLQAKDYTKGHKKVIQTWAQQKEISDKEQAEQQKKESEALEAKSKEEDKIESKKKKAENIKAKKKLRKKP